MNMAKNSFIYGFEDYRIVRVSPFIFSCNTECAVYGSCTDYSYIINKNLALEVNIDTYSGKIDFNPPICNHVELLDTAKRLFIHSNCNLSRSLISEKYKRNMSPYLSDAVVIPNPYEVWIQSYKMALFINEKAKVILAIDISDDEKAENIVKAIPMRSLLRNLINCNINLNLIYHSYIKNTSDVLDAELMYVGRVLRTPSSCSLISDILMSKLPLNKIVYEQSVMQSLSSEANQLTFDNMVSIKDMLDSSDTNTVSAGLKALSMMDWIHYVNSIKFILKKTNGCWKSNKAANSTSVKYMFRTLFESTVRRRWPGAYTPTIYQEDFDLFKQLKVYYDKSTPESILRDLSYMDFMSVSAEGFVGPRIKPSFNPTSAVSCDLDTAST